MSSLKMTNLRSVFQSIQENKSQVLKTIMKLYYLSPNKMENSNKLIFWCLFMVLPFLGLSMYIA